MYAQVKDNKVTRLHYTLPLWYSSDPNQVDDAQLLTTQEFLEAGIWPVNDNVPTINPILESYIEKEKEEWLIDLEKKEVKITYIITPRTFEEAKERAFQDLKLRKKTFETSGLTLGDGTFVRTNEKSQTRITQAYTRVQAFPDTIYKWKMADGTFVDLGKDEILNLYNAIHNHLESCFNQECSLSESIELTTDLNELEVLLPSLIFVA